MAFRYKYPKLSLLALSFIIAYAYFTGGEFHALRQLLQNLGIFGAFISGMMYAYGFTAPIAMASFLVIAKQQNFLIAGFVAGLGAVSSDLLLFKFIRHEFMDELKQLGEEPVISHIKGFFSRTVHVRLKGYLVPLIGAFMIASPFPDELGVSLIASYRQISPEVFAVISYTLNTIGIFTILYVGKII